MTPAQFEQSNITDKQHFITEANTALNDTFVDFEDIDTKKVNSFNAQRKLATANMTRNEFGFKGHFKSAASFGNKQIIYSRVKLSFDFDGTLARKDVQVFVKRLIDDGHEVWIVTSRFDDAEGLARSWNWIPDQNLELFKVAQDLGIPESRIKFTNMIPKIEFLLGKGFAFHLDDDESELFDILESKDECKPINVGHSDWECFCKEIIE